MGQYEDRRLWAAIGKNDKALVEKAIAQGANPNAKGSKTLHGSETVLQRAAGLADAAAIEVLLAHRARQAPGRHKATPLIALILGIPAIKMSKAPDGADRVLRSLDLLLAKRPNLETFGGEEYDKGTVICHAIKQTEGDLEDRVLDRLIDAMSSRKKRFSKEFSELVLSSAFNYGDVATFTRLVDAGADPAALSDMGYPPPVALVSSPNKAQAGQWWDLLASLGVSVDNPGPGVPAKLVEQANARLLETRMEKDLAPAARSTPGPRL